MTAATKTTTIEVPATSRKWGYEYSYSVISDPRGGVMMDQPTEDQPKYRKHIKSIEAEMQAQARATRGGGAWCTDQLFYNGKPVVRIQVPSLGFDWAEGRVQCDGAVKVAHKSYDEWVSVSTIAEAARYGKTLLVTVAE